MFRRFSLLSLVVALSAAGVSAQPDKGADPVKPAPSKIVAVTAYQHTALVTREVTLPFSLRIQNSQATARGTIDIKRLDYGIGRNEWASTNYVADTVTIELTVVASRP